jgi:5-methylcytosine-specific restriction endonuclease McrA
MTKHYSFGWKTVRAVINKTEGKCFYCRCILPESNKEYDEGGKVVSESRNWHIDHFVPLSRGGNHKIENLVPSCINCNMKKLTMTGEEFLLGLSK